MSDDYGYFGSGSEGYAQYTAASGDDKDGKRGGKGGNNGGCKPGCLLIIFGIIFAYLLVRSLE